MKQIVLTDLDSLVATMQREGGYVFSVHVPAKAPDDSHIDYRSARFQDALRRDGCSPGVDTETVFAVIRRHLKREEPAQGALF